MRYLWHVRIKPLLKAAAAITPFVILGVVLWRAEHKGWAVASWLGGGSIVLGVYRMVWMTADYVDDLFDELYWKRKREEEAQEAPPPPPPNVDPGE